MITLEAKAMLSGNDQPNACVKNNLNQLIDNLHQQFPHLYKNPKFLFYPFSNELGHHSVIEYLQQQQINMADKKGKDLQVAILFGEANFLSFLPELQALDLIILADIHSHSSLHNWHLINTLRLANTRAEYFRLYCQEHPLANRFLGFRILDYKKKQVSIFARQYLLDERGKSHVSLRNYHFLASDERFRQVKTAAEKLNFSSINLNMGVIEQCQMLAHLFEKYQVGIRFVNFTNIHHYLPKSLLQSNVKALLAKQENCWLMYATGPMQGLQANITSDIKAYQAVQSNESEIELRMSCIKEKLKVEQQQLQAKHMNKYGICYVGVVYAGKMLEIHHLLEWLRTKRLTDLSLKIFLSPDLAGLEDAVLKYINNHRNPNALHLFNFPAYHPVLPNYEFSSFNLIVQGHVHGIQKLIHKIAQKDELAQTELFKRILYLVDNDGAKLEVHAPKIAPPNKAKL